MFSGCGCPDFFDVDLARDHVVAEPDHDLGEQLEPVAPLVRDQNTQMLDVALHHEPGWHVRFYLRRWLEPRWAPEIYTVIHAKWC